jgi:hypothetical protein
MVTRPPCDASVAAVDAARGWWWHRVDMKPLLFVASVLLGVSGLTQVVPDADRLAQRRVVPRRIGPRSRGGAPAPNVPARVTLGEDGAVQSAESQDPVRCNAACDRTMNTCIDRCRSASNDRTCNRVCFTAAGQCIRACPGDAAAVFFGDAGMGDGMVVHTLPGR